MGVGTKMQILKANIVDTIQSKIVVLNEWKFEFLLRKVVLRLFSFEMSEKTILTFDELDSAKWHPTSYKLIAIFFQVFYPNETMLVPLLNTGYLHRMVNT